MADLPDTDDRRLFLLLLRKTELDEEEAYTVVQEIQNMAAANLISRFEAKLDARFDALNAELRTWNAKLEAQSIRLDAGLKAQSAVLDAELKAQNAELRAIRWMLGLGMVSLGVLLTALRIFG